MNYPTCEVASAAKIELPEKLQIKKANVVVMVALVALALTAIYFLNNACRIGKNRMTLCDFLVSEIENMFADIFACCSCSKKTLPKRNFTPPNVPTNHQSPRTNPPTAKLHTPVPQGMTKAELKRFRSTPNIAGSPLRASTTHFTPTGSKKPPPGYKSPEQFVKEMEDVIKSPNATPVEQAIAFANVYSVPCKHPTTRDVRLSSFSALDESIQKKIKGKTRFSTPSKLLNSLSKKTQILNSSTNSPIKKEINTPLNRLKKSLMGKLIVSTQHEVKSNIKNSVATVINDEFPKDPDYDFDKCMAVTQINFMQEDTPLLVLSAIKKIIENEDLKDFCGQEVTNAYHAWMQIPSCYNDHLLKHLEEQYPLHEFNEDPLNTGFLDDFNAQDKREDLVNILTHLEKVKISDLEYDSDSDSESEIDSDISSDSDSDISSDSDSDFDSDTSIEPAVELAEIKKIIEKENANMPFNDSSALSAWELIPKSYDQELLAYLRKTYPNESFENDNAIDTSFLNSLKEGEWKTVLLNILNHLEGNAGSE